MRERERETPRLTTSRVVETDVTVPIMKILAYLKPLPGKRERETPRLTTSRVVETDVTGERERNIGTWRMNGSLSGCCR